MFKRVLTSPVLVRIAPFAIFAALTLLQGRFGESSQYWIYAIKTIIGAWLIWIIRSYVEEMRWKFSWEAVAVGVAVFVIWVGLDSYCPTLFHRSSIFNPAATFGSGSALTVFFLAARTLGSSLVVPPFEEVFYRSFLYRYLIKSKFLEIPLSRFHWKAFLVSGVVFGFGHYEWLQGILCGFAYQGLVCKKGRLGDAITAHAVTNFLLAVWIIARHEYFFW
jgi:CAAX prenyl protease-like protein